MRKTCYHMYALMLLDSGSRWKASDYNQRECLDHSAGGSVQKGMVLTTPNLDPAIVELLKA